MADGDVTEEVTLRVVRMKDGFNVDQNVGGDGSVDCGLSETEAMFAAARFLFDLSQTFYAKGVRAAEAAAE